MAEISRAPNAPSLARNKKGSATSTVPATAYRMRAVKSLSPSSQKAPAVASIWNGPCIMGLCP